MPQIRPITDLRNTNEISDICHARREALASLRRKHYGAHPCKPLRQQ